MNQPLTPEQPIKEWRCLCHLQMPRWGTKTVDGYLRCQECKRVWTIDGVMVNPPEQAKSAYQWVCEQECKWCAKGNFSRHGTHEIFDLSGKNRDQIDNYQAYPCTAPSPLALIERQAAQIATQDESIQEAVRVLCEFVPDAESYGSALNSLVIGASLAVTDSRAKIAAMQATLTKGGHAADCSFLEWECSQPGCSETHSIPCNCYLSDYLSDDIERGKELLGAKEAKEKSEQSNKLRAILLRDILDRFGYTEAKYWDSQGMDFLSTIDQLHEDYVRVHEDRDEARATSQRQAVEIEELRRATDSAYMRGFADGNTGAVNAISAAMKEKP